MKPSEIPSGAKVSYMVAGNTNRFYGEVRRPSPWLSPPGCAVWDGTTEQLLFDEDEARLALRVEEGKFWCAVRVFQEILNSVEADERWARYEATAFADIRDLAPDDGRSLYATWFVRRVSERAMAAILKSVACLSSSGEAARGGDLREFHWKYVRPEPQPDAQRDQELLRDIRTALAIPEGGDILTRVRDLAELQRRTKAFVESVSRLAGADGKA